MSEPPHSAPAQPEAGTPEPEASSPRRLLRRFGLLSIASVLAILILVGAGQYRVYRSQLIKGAEESSVAVGLAMLGRERQALVQASGEGQWRIGVQPGDFKGLDERMRSFLAPFGIVKIKVYDADRKIVYSTDTAIVGKVDQANERLERVLANGAPDTKLVSKDRIADLKGESLHRVDVVETYVAIRAGEKIIGSFEVYIDVTPSYDRLETAVEWSAAVLLLVLCTVFGGFYFLMRQGTTQLEGVQGRLKELATTDMLTGLANRRHLFARIGEECARMERARLRRVPMESLGIIMADIDRFKAINDAHGHQVGDEVLRQVALCLKSSLRPYDIIGRYGGEEFLIALPHTSLADSALVAERMRAAVAQIPFEADGKSIAVTASFGVAYSADNTRDISIVVKRADENLYGAKQGGRNKVVASS